MSGVCCTRFSAVLFTSVLLLQPLQAQPPEAKQPTAADTIAQAQSLLATGKGKAAVSLLQTAIAQRKQAAQKNPQDAANLFHLGRLLAELQQDAAALKQFQAAIALEPKNAEYQFHQGMLLYYMNKPDEAIAALQRAASQAPQDAAYTMQLARVCVSLRKDDLAIAAYESTIALAPRNTDALLGLAVVLIERRSFAKAGKLVTRALAIDPADASTLMVAGNLYHQQGKLEQAATSFQAILKTQPEHEVARSTLVQIYSALEKPKQRDQQIAALYKMFSSGKTSRSYFRREQFTVGKKEVYASEYFELAGDRAVKFHFDVADKGGRVIRYRISLGSYKGTNDIAKATGALKDGQRLYHLDYYRGGEHRTYGMTAQAAPDYAETRKQVVDIINGVKQPISSSSSTNKNK